MQLPRVKALHPPSFSERFDLKISELFSKALVSIYSIYWAWRPVYFLNFLNRNRKAYLWEQIDWTLMNVTCNQHSVIIVLSHLLMM